MCVSVRGGVHWPIGEWERLKMEEWRERDGMVLSHGALIPEAMGNQSSLELLARWKEES